MHECKIRLYVDNLCTVNKLIFGEMHVQDSPGILTLDCNY